MHRIDGPSCPTCGCQDGETLQAFTILDSRVERRRCNHCGGVFHAEILEEAGEPVPPEAPPIVYTPVRCPECGGKDVRVASKRALGIRWHKCRDCQATFKSVEED